MRRAMGCSGLVLLGLLVLVLASPTPSEARGHVFFDIGVPLWGGPGYWGAPYYYNPYPAPPVIVQQPAPLYEPPAPTLAAPAYWYYCQNPPGYYPYIQQCPNGWMQVVPPTSPPR